MQMAGVTDSRQDLRPRKRSITIAGHRTSISIEEPFWQALLELAAAEGTSPTELVRRIDAGRGRTNLSSAVRLYLFEFFKAAAAHD